MRTITGLGLLSAAALAAGCDTDAFGPDSRYDPRGLEGYYEWVLQRWDQGAATGYPVVNLSWEIPTNYRNEPFRVYARYGGGGYGLIATVTSCSDGICRYADTNVAHGRSYDYYVAAVDERDRQEIGTTRAITVDVPGRADVATPAAPDVVALDGAAYLRWEPTGAQVYMVLAGAPDGTVYIIGESDGTGFFDDRAENGQSYDYYLAGMDQDGHVSALSQAGQAIPRPDFFAEVIYTYSDLPSASGFRFVGNESDDPIVAGDAPAAQWRLEENGETLTVRPLGQTTITAGTFTTDLTCGPASDETCVDVSVAPASTQFGTAAAVVEPGSTYVLRVIASDGRMHYAKLRVQGSTRDSQGRSLMVFDWAYQLRPDEPRLVRVSG